MATRAEVNFICSFAIEYLLRHHEDDPVVRDAVIRALVVVGKRYNVKPIAREALKELYTKITGRPVANNRDFLLYLRNAVGSDGTVKTDDLSIDDVELPSTGPDVQ